MAKVDAIEIKIDREVIRKPMYHSEIIMQLLRNNGYKIFAEVGVWRGITCEHILSHLKKQLREYWAIDKWEFLGYNYRTERKRSSEIRATPQHWEELHKNCCALMLKYWQLKILRMESEKAASLFPDHYFDMVYIDADHRYEHVLRDIGAWKMKVKREGLLAGHDYGGGRWPGVKKAVDDSFGEPHIKTYTAGQVWTLRMP